MNLFSQKFLSFTHTHILVTRHLDFRAEYAGFVSTRGVILPSALLAVCSYKNL